MTLSSGIGRVPDAARVLVALVAGIALGLAISGTANSSLRLVVSAAETIGTLWLNAIRMTVLPLVAALLVSRIAGTSGSVGRVGAKAFALFVLLATAGAVFAGVVAPPLVNALPLDPGTLESIRSKAVPPPTELPPFRDWLTALVPPNPLKAATDGALLPFVVFMLCFALALSRTDDKNRLPIVQFFEAISRTMFVLIGWIISLSSIGVFALGLSLAARGGAGVASALGLYVATVSFLLATATALLYPFVVIVAGVPFLRFAKACAPVQAIAFSTRSSFASLPVLIDRAEHELGINPKVSGIVLPVAVSVFKFGMPLMRLTGTCFIARLFGIQLNWADVLAIGAALIVASFYTPGVPSGSLFILAPVYQAFGLPMEGIGLQLAVDLVPDMFVTVSNTTADMAVTAVLSRSTRAHTVSTVP